MKKKISFLRIDFSRKGIFSLWKKHSRNSICSVSHWLVDYAHWWIQNSLPFWLRFSTLSTFSFHSWKNGKKNPFDMMMFCWGLQNLTLIHSNNLKFNNFQCMCSCISTVNHLSRLFSRFFLSLLLALNKSLTTSSTTDCCVVLQNTKLNVIAKNYWKYIFTYKWKNESFFQIRFSCRFACLNTKLIANWCFIPKSTLYPLSISRFFVQIKWIKMRKSAKEKG
jgi:hypothetical protein